MESRTVRASCSTGIFIDSSWATFTETWKDRCNCGQLRVRLTFVRDISGVLCQPESFDSPCTFRLNTENWSITKQNLFSHTRREFASASPKTDKGQTGEGFLQAWVLGGHWPLHYFICHPTFSHGRLPWSIFLYKQSITHVENWNTFPTSPKDCSGHCRFLVGKERMWSLQFDHDSRSQVPGPRWVWRPRALWN